MSSSLRVLRHRDFRLLFLGQAASVVGDRVLVVAIALFVTQRTGSPTDLGFVLTGQTLPLVALLLIGGVWADRLPRQRIMIATDLTRAALHALLAVLILTDAVRVWEIVVIEAGFGAAMAFFQPAYTGLIPQTVPEDLIQDAKALTEMTANVAFLAGPALATLLVLTIGAGEAFVFDAATFVLSAWLLAGVRPQLRGAALVTGSLVKDLRAGWREVRSRSWVWVTIAVFTGALLCMFAPWYALARRGQNGLRGRFGVPLPILMRRSASPSSSTPRATLADALSGPAHRCGAEPSRSSRPCSLPATPADDQAPVRFGNRWTSNSSSRLSAGCGGSVTTRASPS